MSSDPFANDPFDTGAHAHHDARESFRTVMWASALTLVLWFVPYVGLVLYPLRLFVTYVHEICHAAAALLTGGWPHDIQIFLDTSGVTYTSGGLGIVISSAGYVGTPLVGAGLLLLASRRSAVRPALLGTAVVLAISAVALGGNVLAWASGLGLGAVIAALALKASPRSARFWLSFLAVQCILNALSDLRMLFWLSLPGAAAAEVHTDARNMSDATGGLVPAVVWTVLWAGIAVGVLVAAGRVYYVSTVKKSFGGGQPF